VRAATAAADGPRERVYALARAYLDFAARNPAVYDAIFQLDGGLPYAREDTPEPLKDAFAALLECLGEAAGDGVHPGLFTETFWAALHGVATLTRAGRLPPADTERRVELLVDRLAII
jgi:AcrR family transcriptional regulator